MNKNRLTLVIIGGVIALGVLILAFLDWSAYSARTAAAEGDEEEGTDGLETVVAKAQQLSRKGVYPCLESVKAVEANSEAVAAWKTEAVKLAARGDRPTKVTTPAQFKTDIVAEAKRLAALPGGVQGVLAKPEFTFGPFKEYIVEGKMPAEPDLKRLTRQWEDVVSVVEVLSACGIVELTGIDFKAAPAAAEEEPAHKEKKKGKKGKGAARAAPVFAPSASGYVFTFTTRPAAFVKVINALETCERFAVVDDFTFTRAKDPVAAALGGEVKKEGQASGGRRGRRGRAVVRQEKKKDDELLKNGIITDPLLDEPFTVTLTVTVYDFGSLETAGEKTEEEQK